MSAARATALFIWFIPFIFIGCGKKISSTGNSGKLKTIGYEIPVGTFTNGPGCLNIVDLYSRLSQVPKDAVGRYHSTHLSVSDTDIDGAPVRPQLKSLLALSALRIKEGPLTNLHEVIYSGQQLNCDGIVFDKAINGHKEFTITEYDHSRLLLSYDDQPRLEFRHLSENALHITYYYEAMDICPSYKITKATKTAVLQWGKPSFKQQNKEIVSASMVKSAVEALKVPPKDLQDTLLASDAEADLILPVSQIRQLSLSPVKPHFYKCPHLAKAPDGDDPEIPEEERDTDAPETEPEPIPEQP